MGDGVLSKIVTEIKDASALHWKDEERGDVSPFHNLDKSQVLQETKVFNDASFVKNHPKRCCALITKLLYLLTQGQGLGADSAMVFFGVTKLFQSTDGNLRRMVYLFLKEVAESTDSGDVIIVVQSLVKDMFNDVPLYKGNAIRVLSRIVDAGMLGQVERYFKQSIVDRDEFVSSAALVSSLLLARSRAGCADAIARWSSEVLTVLNTSKADMVQFHALALLRTVKRGDRLAVSKLVQSLLSSGMRSPLGLCLLVRYVSSLLLAPNDAPQATVQQGYAFLESCLQHKNEIVVYEAARALVSPPGGPEALAASGRDISPAVTVLQLMATSPKPGQRYAAVRTLSRLAGSHPAAVAKCNDELEGLIADPNRVIGTLAITALLKTGSEATADRLIKQISSFMLDVGSDELKVLVVRGVHRLGLRVPSKHRAIMVFLSNLLRDEGEFEFKKAILDALLDIMAEVPESRTEGLFHCCEFIEDCEYTALATRVLHLLGKEGPALPAPQPALFIRYIYNRVILENAAVRASAVSALAKFATACEDLRPQIVPLLQRCTDDDDDEVRDRAALYLSLLGAPVMLAAKGAAAGAGAGTGAGAGAAGASATGAAKQRGSGAASSSSDLLSSGGGGGADLSADQLAAILGGGEAAAGAGAGAGATAAGGAGGAPDALALAALTPAEASISRALTSGTLPMPVATLTKALKLYQARPAAGPFAFAALPFLEQTQAQAQAAGAGDKGGFGYASEVRAPEAAAASAKQAGAKVRAADAASSAPGAAGGGGAPGGAGGAGGAGASGGGAGGAGGKDGGGGGGAGGASQDAAVEAVLRVAEFASFGPLFRSSRPQELTERELEYLVSCQKFIFAAHVVFAFSVTNTVPDLLLERVAARLAPSEPGAYRQVASLSCPRVREGQAGVCYVAFARAAAAGLAACTFGCELRFNVRECDPAKGYEPVGDASPEEYPVADVELTPADFVARVPVPDFRAAWDAMGAAGEAMEGFALSFRTVAEAVAATIDTLGLAPCEGSGQVKAGGNKHQALLSGVLLGDVRVLARMIVTLDESGCTLKLAVRAPSKDVAELLMSCVT